MKKAPTFTINDVVPIAIVFVVTTIVLSFGATIVADVQTKQTEDSYAANISGKGLESLETFGGNLPLLATIVVASIIISILLIYMGGKMMSN